MENLSNKNTKYEKHYTELWEVIWLKCCWKTLIYCLPLQRAAEFELVKMLLENAHLLSPLTEGCWTRVGQNAVGKHTFIVVSYRGLPNPSWSKCCWKTLIYCHSLQRAAELELVKMLLENTHLLSPLIQGCWTRAGQKSRWKTPIYCRPLQRAAELELVKMLLENAHLLAPLTEGCRTRALPPALSHALSFWQLCR